MLPPLFGVKRGRQIGAELAAAAVPVFWKMPLLPECHRWAERALLALDHIVIAGTDLAHDPEKWTPVFGKDQAPSTS
jgi:hypothetical protein